MISDGSPGIVQALKINAMPLVVEGRNGERSRNRASKSKDPRREFGAGCCSGCEMIHGHKDGLAGNLPNGMPRIYHAIGPPKPVENLGMSISHQTRSIAGKEAFRHEIPELWLLRMAFQVGMAAHRLRFKGVHERQRKRLVFDGPLRHGCVKRECVSFLNSIN